MVIYNCSKGKGWETKVEVQDEKVSKNFWKTSWHSPQSVVEYKCKKDKEKSETPERINHYEEEHHDRHRRLHQERSRTG